MTGSAPRHLGRELRGVRRESLTYTLEQVEQVLARLVAQLIDAELGARSHDGSPQKEASLEGALGELQNEAVRLDGCLRRWLAGVFLLGGELPLAVEQLGMGSFSGCGELRQRWAPADRFPTAFDAPRRHSRQPLVGLEA